MAGTSGSEGKGRDMERHPELLVLKIPGPPELLAEAGDPLNPDEPEDESGGPNPQDAARGLLGVAFRNSAVIDSPRTHRL